VTHSCDSVDRVAESMLANPDAVQPLPAPARQPADRHGPVLRPLGHLDPPRRRLGRCRVAIDSALVNGILKLLFATLRVGWARRGIPQAARGSCADGEGVRLRPRRGELSPTAGGLQFGTRCSIASVAPTDAEGRAAFWRQYQPGMRSTEAEVGTPEFFADVEAKRYRQESHIAEFADFENWASADVLEVGCGIGTDGVRFASAGANYTGIDFSEVALDLARRQFELNGLLGQFIQVSLPNLPFADDSFDLVYSFGVLHHIPETDAGIAEIYRVLRPGGHVLVMLYHRHSVNYYVTIMTLRRLLAAVLLIPHGAEVVGRITREQADVLEGHRELLRRYGWHYFADRDIFLSHNTDGPGNPLSKVYTSKDTRRLFSSFRDVRSHVRYLNLRLYPGGEKLARSRLGRSLERRFGWHLIIEATKH
jgi:SAM-dependent methyltransferase